MTRELRPRVSIMNCVSTAIEMLKFSSESILNNAGYDNFDYVVVTWLPSPEVEEYLKQLELSYRDSTIGIFIEKYTTNPNVEYVPNLRGMMNKGFTEGFNLNEYCGLVNTDQYFGRDWLVNLVKYMTEDTIVNCTSIQPLDHPAHINVDLGLPEKDTFNMTRFNELYEELYEDILLTEEDRGGRVATNTMPYLFHRKYWESCGPWELELGKDSSPDVRFFERCHNAGVKFTMSRSSICYHYEAAERRGKRPEGVEDMKEE